VAEETARRTGFQVVAGTAENAPLDRQYGAIVLRHVIEHLRDPHAVLRRLAGALAPGGVLYVATPDSTAWAARVFGRRWWGYEVPRHLVIFSSSALRGALGQAGFRVLDEHWAFSPDMWNGSLYLALDRGRGLQWTRRATSLANPLLSGVTAVAAGAEALLGRSTMYSVIAQAAA
jgi:SAM-dependent methyltransferase